MAGQTKKATVRKRKVPYGQARESIRAAARTLFYEKGLQTGLEEILKRADASKPTFYHHFKGKAALETEYLRSEAQDLWAGFDRIARRARTPRQFITRWMDVVRRRTLTVNFTGCPIGNFAIQSGAQQTAEVRQVFGLSIERFQETLVAKGMAPARARELAPTLFMIYEGSFLMVRATGDRSHFTRATKLMASLAE